MSKGVVAVGDGISMGGQSVSGLGSKIGGNQGGDDQSGAQQGGAPQGGPQQKEPSVTFTPHLRLSKTMSKMVRQIS